MGGNINTIPNSGTPAQAPRLRACGLRQRHDASGLSFRESEQVLARIESQLRAQVEAGREIRLDWISFCRLARELGCSLFYLDLCCDILVFSNRARNDQGERLLLLDPAEAA
jgi:hypothetical protein